MYLPLMLFVMPKLAGGGTPLFLGGSHMCSNYSYVVWPGVNAVVGFWKIIPQGKKRGGNIVTRHGNKPREVHGLIVLVTT